MVVRLGQTSGYRSRAACDAFTLIEILVSFVILSLVMAGIIYGYVQANRMAEWSSMSLAAQSFASQGAEQARAAKWEAYQSNPVLGPVAGSTDELPPWTNYLQTNYLDVPIKGSPSATDFAFWVTNIISISNVSADPPLRQIRSDAVWTFFATGVIYTNEVVLLRGPDQ